MIIDPSKKRNRGDLINLNQKRKNQITFFFPLIFSYCFLFFFFFLFFFYLFIFHQMGYGKGDIVGG
jgi:hypothetical protein